MMNGETVSKETPEETGGGSMEGNGTIPRVTLGEGLVIPRLVNGMLQVAGDHGHINQQKAVEQMMQYHQKGLTAFEMADMYGPAEEIFGRFVDKLRSQQGELALRKVQGITKHMPRPGQNTRKLVEQAVDRSLQLMKVVKLDCLQVFWWDYSDKRYLEVFQHLTALQHDGKIGELSVSDYDTPHLKELVERGVRICSNQVQYSLIDMRPAAKMAPFCEANDIKILAYGVLAGGFISEKYLGRPEPLGKAELNNPSLVRYKEHIDFWGGWQLFQELLKALAAVAARHQVSIANVAARWVLDQPGVGAVLLGCPFGGMDRSFLGDNLRLFQLQLSRQDLEEIRKVTRRSHDLTEAIGGCGDEFH